MIELEKGKVKKKQKYRPAFEMEEEMMKQVFPNEVEAPIVEEEDDVHTIKAKTMYKMVEEVPAVLVANVNCYILLTSKQI